MKYNTGITAFFLVAFGLLFLFPEVATATQAHAAPEGIYAHQIGHIFFTLSMGFLVYWLRQRGLVSQVGWRYIQYAALFFILWNIDTFTVHLLDELFVVIQVEQVGSWRIQISARPGFSGFEKFYYIAKLDHLLCLPALLFLYSGLKRLLKESYADGSR